MAKQYICIFKMSTVFIALGSNLGDRQSALKQARFAISQQIGEISQESSIYETEAWGYDGEKYLNQVIEIRSSLEPHDLLDAVLEIETELGRSDRTGAFENRIIDIDILFYDDLVMISHDLIIPHPHMKDRRFVLEPLAEISRDWIHPIFKITAGQMLVDLKDGLTINKVACDTLT